jgi:prepilin-type N-terminal cleavage/methylation domain-containing protein
MRVVRHQGVTLVELLVGITILVALSVFVAPSFKSIMLNRTVVAMKDNMISALRFAQSQASKSNYPVVLCATADFSACSTSTDDWKKIGWMVYERKAATIAATDILRVYQAPKVDVTGFTFSLVRMIGSVSTPAFALEFASGGLPAIGHANASVRVCNMKSRDLYTVSVRPSGIIEENVSIATGGCPV